MSNFILIKKQNNIGFGYWNGNVTKEDAIKYLTDVKNPYLLNSYCYYIDLDSGKTLSGQFQAYLKNHVIDLSDTGVYFEYKPASIIDLTDLEL